MLKQTGFLALFLLATAPMWKVQTSEPCAYPHLTTCYSTTICKKYIEKYGHPMFAVIPYEDYLNLLPKDERATVPHEVVGLVVKEGVNLVRAWRKYLGLTQAEISRRAGISQAALSQVERADNQLRNATLEKLARAMGLSIDQLTD